MPQHRRGVALILVLMLVALAAIVSFALLSASTLQAKVSGNSNIAMIADSNAESGLNLALYYLQHPQSAPTLSGGSTPYYPGSSSLSLGNAGTVALAISNPSSKTFDIVSSATIGSGSTALTRTVKASAYLNASYQVTQALLANRDLSLPGSGSGVTVTVNGSARIDGTLSVASPSTISGNKQAVAIGAGVSSADAVPKYPTVAAPDITDLTIAKNLPLYYWRGKGPYLADQLTINPSGGSLQTTRTGSRVKDSSYSGDNPGNVWYTTSTRTFTGTVSVPGTLVIIRDSSAPTTAKHLRVGGVLRITPKSGYPGLVVVDDVQFQGSNRQLIVDGLAWIGGKLTNNASGAAVVNGSAQINGALMLANKSAQAIDSSGFQGTVSVTYSASNLDLPDLCDGNQTPSSVTVIQWGKVSTDP
jgi:Tfp pilus assembly protein PilX